MIFIVGCGKVNSGVSLIPETQNIKLSSGRFKITELTQIAVGSDNGKVNEI